MEGSPEDVDTSPPPFFYAVDPGILMSGGPSTF